MKRDLLTQMKNEWKENFWLVLELMIVGLAVWYFCIVLVNAAFRHAFPKGFDAERVYTMKVKWIRPESPKYTDFGEESASKAGTAVMTMLNKIRSNPHVEAAAVSANAMPYQLSMYGTGLRVSPEDTVPLSVNLRMASPDIVKVLNLQSLNGVSQEKMIELMQKGESLLASYSNYDRKKGIGDMLGRQLYLGGDSVPRIMSHVLIPAIVRTDFEGETLGTLVKPILDNDLYAGKFSELWEVAVRLRPGEEMAFVNDFRADATMRECMNVYLAQPRSLMADRDSVQRNNLLQIRMMVGGSAFLLLLVFLGLFGTFWYRIRERESETAIRMVAGATKGDIFRRLISEGLILVAVSAVVPLVLGILFYFKWSDMVEADHNPWIYVIAGAAALILIVLVVTTGIAIPAQRAMKVEPAIALKEE